MSITTKKIIKTQLFSFINAISTRDGGAYYEHICCTTLSIRTSY